MMECCKGKIARMGELIQEVMVKLHALLNFIGSVWYRSQLRLCLNYATEIFRIWNDIVLVLNKLGAFTHYWPFFTSVIFGCTLNILLFCRWHTKIMKQILAKYYGTLN